MTAAGLAALTARAEPANPNARLQALGRLRPGEQNQTEQAYDAHLNAQLQTGEIQWYRFESIKLRLADNTFLTMDFAVLRADGVFELHDCKGSKAIVTDDFRVKVKVAASIFPFVFKVVYPRKKRDGGGWDVEEV